MDERLGFGIAFAYVAASCFAASVDTASNSFTIKLPSPALAEALLTTSPFGINTAFNPSTPDLDARLEANAGGWDQVGAAGFYVAADRTAKRGIRLGAVRSAC